MDNEGGGCGERGVEVWGREVEEWGARNGGVGSGEWRVEMWGVEMWGVEMWGVEMWGVESGDVGSEGW
ncbi:MAG: hypothetical protein HUK04_01220 [Bacteroidaceae bacterium]|nr:hypothetical protein [Bacteroidaceae bacterium]